MASGLSLEEKLRESHDSDVVARIGHFWDGKLEDWLQVALPAGCAERYDASPEDYPDLDQPNDDETIVEWSERQRHRVQTWSFPTTELRDEYLESVNTREEPDVLALLRLFLFDNQCFGRDQDNLDILINRPDEELNPWPTEYKARLFQYLGGSRMPQPGVRWALDLLPHSPQRAIDAVTAYLRAHSWGMPDGRVDGMLDATAIIRARWIEDTVTHTISDIGDRDLEKLAAALYDSMGYSVVLTPRTRDKGRDVVATRETPGQQEVVEIECKTSSNPIGVIPLRSLQGVVSRGSSNKGILITSGKFTRGAKEEAANDPRIELVAGSQFVKLLNSRFGSTWHLNYERIVQRFN